MRVRSGTIKSSTSPRASNAACGRWWQSIARGIPPRHTVARSTVAESRILSAGFTMCAGSSASTVAHPQAHGREYRRKLEELGFGLTLAMPDLRPHAALLPTHFASPFSRFLRSHGVSASRNGQLVWWRAAPSSFTPAASSEGQIITYRRGGSQERYQRPDSSRECRISTNNAPGS
jgi:hypothetical protein